ncbi:hypothetical protein fugu_012304 [Takifugu bimaculatus]|uniref:Amino acid transporter transmembrane domain-containing protein n=1 Tax=Takifugu bimaculatus TaxID=433685 RepID=A0A4Z2CA31_9TELE|nr:hypothetical protein fugu_012304 [Takifugu bimaculatus]
MEELARDSISLLASAAPKSSLRLWAPGLLNFPWAFAKAGGIHNAVAVELASLVFLVSGLVILGYSSSVSGRCTYQAVVREMCGLAIGHLCEICFIFNLFMISVAFLVIMDDQLGKHQRFALVLLCGLLILPMSIHKEISVQKYSSVLGTLAATYMTIAIVIKYHNTPSAVVHISPSYSSGVGPERDGLDMSRGQKDELLGLHLYCHSHHLLRFPRVYGYLTFGKEVKADVLMSYSSDDVVMIIARLLFAVSLVTIYPIVLLLGRSVIQDHLLRRWRPCAGVSALESRSRYVVTVLWITVTLLFAIFVPDISKIISVIGGVSAFFIFIFPGLCLMFAMQSEPVAWRTRVILTLWGAFTLVCGAFIFGQSTTITIMQILGKI